MAKTIDRKQKSSPEPAQIFPTKTDFWSILCNSCAIARELLLTKANSPHPQNKVFSNVPDIAKKQCPDKKIPTQTKFDGCD
jgi:hypothetical protein